MSTLRLDDGYIVSLDVARAWLRAVDGEEFIISDLMLYIVERKLGISTSTPLGKARRFGYVDLEERLYLLLESNDSIRSPYAANEEELRRAKCLDFMRIINNLQACRIRKTGATD